MNTRNNIFLFPKTLKYGIIGQFLTSRLNSKISLSIGDDRFVRITILDDQVAGVAGEFYIIDRVFGS